ncbi:energy-coupling factor transporter transmembrane protein EcfT [Natronoglycomyces albus]|uniref:Energy-coupling factor transporter transmembrane protein EcfT n=1 Tax=Natronoglycomyces albus TaxID=2811108 RepID=A0A895XWL1_9ACTN|nr:energy-coupling factor transporter transmembrane protein EcfT [Natronoglycomyces albus]
MGATQRPGIRLHPVAWWAWALLLATTASQTVNPWILLLIIAVSGYVVFLCRGDEPWSGAWRIFLFIGLVAISIRMLFYLIFGGSDGTTVLFELPSIALGEWAQGFRLGGAVTAEGATAAAYDGLRLATLLVCIGAANSLASPKRMLRSMPAALYEISVAIVVALSVAPQLVASTVRVNRARALRGDTKRNPAHFMRTVVSPVLHEALDRALALAAAMSARGYGRSADIPPKSRALTSTLLLAGLIGLCIGAYGLLSAATAAPVAWTLLVVGVGLAVGGLIFASRRVPHTRYRPDPFGAREWSVVVAGACALAAVIVTAQLNPVGVWPVTDPLTMPSLPLLAALGVLAAAWPVVVAAQPKQSNFEESAA